MPAILNYKQQFRLDPTKQLFPKDKPEELDNNYPMYSLWAVDMPAPGEDFVATAESLSGEKPPANYAKGIFEPNFFTEWLSALYRAAIYKHGFSFNVVPKKGKPAITVKTVPGSLWYPEGVADGPRQARIMILGKCPGWEEIASGQNFSGPTSQILIKALAELGITEDIRAEWYCSNVIKFANPDTKGSGVLQASWVKDCLPILHQELRLVKPSYLLCLGDDAVKALFGKTTNTNNTTGRVLDLTIPLFETSEDTPQHHTIKVMTCMHPARVARAPDLLPQFHGSLALFNTLINGGSVGKLETDLELLELTKESELELLVNKLLNQKADCFAMDCEWQGDYPGEPGSYLRTIQVAWGPKSSACIVNVNAEGKPFEGKILPHLQQLLKNTSDRQVRIIGHNFRADLPWLVNFGLDLRPEFDAPPTSTAANKLGGFDTMLAVHAWQETHPLGLEMCSSQLLGFPRYDIPLEEWKVEYCKQIGIKKSELGGYGKCPDSILHPYANYDAIVTWRLFDMFNKPGGKLDADKFGNNCWKPFWLSMRASLAFLEMEMNGVLIDVPRAEDMTETYQLVYNDKLNKLREMIKWPEFNPSSTRHRTEMLFGENYNASKVRVRPEGARSLGLVPIKTTGKRSKTWDKIVERREQSEHSVATDKETLSAICSSQDCSSRYPEAILLRDMGFLQQLLRTVLRPPTTVESDSQEEVVDEAGDKVYDKGLLSFIQSDGRIRTHFFQTKETGRASSSRPALQNWSSKREDDYKRILGAAYKHPIRSLIKAGPGNVLIEADYSSAEVAALAWMCQSTNLMDHVRRGMLPEDDPNYFDIHSNTCVKSFKLTCEPTKKALKALGMGALRVAAKSSLFGLFYGQSAEGCARIARQEGANVTDEDTKLLMRGISDLYPEMQQYFNNCKSRARVGWMSSCFGRYRRVAASEDRTVIGESERQLMNFGMQSAVADAVSIAMDNIYHYREYCPDVQFKLLLQIHDALLLEVPIQHVPKVYDEVLPRCMSDLVDIWPTDLDGHRLANITKPYHFGIGKSVYKQWGVSITKSECIDMGLDEKYGE